MNLKIPFYTPEEYFLGDPPLKYVLGAFNPLDYISTPTTSLSFPLTTPLPFTSCVSPVSPPVTLDIILFVGSPASGKSTFYHTHLQSLGYERINQDTLKTRDRCLSTAETLLLQNKPIVIGPSLSPSNNRQHKRRKSNAKTLDRISSEI
jgi:bifunctional polynucleotide phosphatase/kinase